MKLEQILYGPTHSRAKYRVTLTETERHELEDLTRKGKAAAQRIRHAWVLLKADSSPQGPGWSDDRISDAYDVDHSTIYRIRKAFVEENLEVALQGKPTTRVYERKLDGEHEAHLIALACSAAPEGAARWSLRLLRDRFIALEGMPDVSHETVRQVLKKTNSSLGG